VDFDIPKRLALGILTEALSSWWGECRENAAARLLENAAPRLVENAPARLGRIRLRMLKRFIFWEFPRGSWQYDVIVGVILAFIFLTPRGWFRDQPRIPRVSVISMAQGEFMVDPEFLTGIPQDQWLQKLTPEVRTRAGNKHLTVTNVEPFTDSDGELRFYIAFTRP